MQFLLVESCSDDSYHARSFGSGLSDLALARYIVELEPSAVSVFYDALCSDDLAAFVQAVDDVFKFSPGVLVACLSSDFIEHLISIVSVVVMMVMVVMSASALMVVVMMVVLVIMFIMIMVMMMFAMFVFIVIVMMVVMMVFMVMVVVIVMVVMFSHLSHI